MGETLVMCLLIYWYLFIYFFQFYLKVFLLIFITKHKARKAELDRRQAELDRREEELRTASINGTCYYLFKYVNIKIINIIMHFF